MVAACREILQTAHNFDTVLGVRTPGFYTPRSEMTRITTFDDLVPKSGVSGRRLQQQLGCYEFWAEELPPTTKTDHILTCFLTVLNQKCPGRRRYIEIDSWKWVKNHYNHCSLPRRHFWLLPTLNLTWFWPQFWGFLQMPISSYLNMGSISTSWNLLPKTYTNLDLILTEFWCSEQLASSSFWHVFDMFCLIFTCFYAEIPQWSDLPSKTPPRNGCVLAGVGFEPAPLYSKPIIFKVTFF